MIKMIIGQLFKICFYLSRVLLIEENQTKGCCKFGPFGLMWWSQQAIFSFFFIITVNDRISPRGLIWEGGAKREGGL